MIYHLSPINLIKRFHFDIIQLFWPKFSIFGESMGMKWVISEAKAAEVITNDLYEGRGGETSQCIIPMQDV